VRAFVYILAVFVFVGRPAQVNAGDGMIGPKGTMACYARCALELYLSDPKAFKSKMRHEPPFFVGREDGTVCYPLEPGAAVKVIEEERLGLPPPNSGALVVMPEGALLPILVPANAVVK